MSQSHLRQSKIQWEEVTCRQWNATNPKLAKSIAAAYFGAFLSASCSYSASQWWPPLAHDFDLLSFDQNWWNCAAVWISISVHFGWVSAVSDCTMSSSGCDYYWLCGCAVFLVLMACQACLCSSMDSIIFTVSWDRSGLPICHLFLAAIVKVGATTTGLNLQLDGSRVHSGSSLQTTIHCHS